MIKNEMNNEVRLEKGELYNRLQDAFLKVENDANISVLMAKRYISDELNFCFYKMKNRDDLLDVLGCIQDNNMYNVKSIIDEVVNNGLRGKLEIQDELWNNRPAWQIVGGKYI